MSNEEKRRIQADTLIEFEEAKADLAVLRAKAVQARAFVDLLSGFFQRMARENSYDEARSAELREKLLSQRSKTLDSDAALALDGEIATALERLRRAEAAKSSLGF